MSDDYAVRAKGVVKEFVLPHQRVSTIKSKVVSLFRGFDKESQLAVNDVSFEVKEGEFFGIVGRNGSGKSTLLKCMAGVYTPNKGSIKVKGKLVPFIELGVGFNPELSGRDNVYLNGALLGFSHKQMDAMYEDIVEFAELGAFMDQKLKNYSSGMQVRLAFSIAIRAEGDVLLLDEVLAVGDSGFQQKCYDYFNELKRDKKTIILVSHNMPIVEKFCDRVMFMESGKVKKIGDSSTISSMYEEMFIREEAERQRKERRKGDSQDKGSEITVRAVEVRQSNKKTERLKAKTNFEVAVTLKSNQDIQKANCGINIKNRDRQVIISTDTLDTIGFIKLKKNKQTTVTFSIENVLTNGLYCINLGVADNGLTAPKMLLRQENAGEFTVEGIGVHALGLIHPEIKVKLSK